MVEITIVGALVHIEVKGLDKLWAFKGSLEIPVAHIRGVRADPEIAKGWWKGVRAPGTSIPGVIRAGTFYQEERRVFWDVHRPENTIVIELHDERYDQLIVEVEFPRIAVERITKAMSVA